MQNLKKVQTCAAELRERLSPSFIPRTGLVLGTGLGDIAGKIQDPQSIPYAELTGFPVSTVQSHAGRFIAGRIQDVPVIAQQGRCHIYEGRSPSEVVMGVRVMATLGITRLIVTNAAGAINPRYETGTLMLIEDQINFSGHSPLTGTNQDEWGVRFPDVSELYDPEMLALFSACALEIGLGVEKGVYICVPGPQLETRAETRACRMLGADAVGMSTALEAIAAHHMGVRVAGISCLSNKNLPDCMEKASIEDIVKRASHAGKGLERLIWATLPRLASL